MTAETAEAVDVSAAIEVAPIPGANPGRPAKALEWSRGVGRRLDMTGYLTDRGRGLRPSVVKAVAFALMIHADAEGKCYPGAGTLAEVSGVSRRVVFDAIACLEHYGWLRVFRDETDDGRKKGADTRANSYWLCFPATVHGGSAPGALVSGAHGGSAPGAPIPVSGAHPNSPEGGRRAGPSPSATPSVKEKKEELGFVVCNECTAAYAGSCRDIGGCVLAWKELHPRGSYCDRIHPPGTPCDTAA